MANNVISITSNCSSNIIRMNMLNPGIECSNPTNNLIENGSHPFNSFNYGTVLNSLHIKDGSVSQYGLWSSNKVSSAITTLNSDVIKRTLNFSTVSEMLLYQNYTKGQAVHVLGYYIAGDGGAGDWLVDDIVSNGIDILSSPASGLSLKHMFQGALKAASIGMTQDNTASENTVILNRAIQRVIEDVTIFKGTSGACCVELPSNGICKIETINLTHNGLCLDSDSYNPAELDVVGCITNGAFYCSATALQFKNIKMMSSTSGTGKGIELSGNCLGMLTENMIFENLSSAFKTGTYDISGSSHNNWSIINCTSGFNTESGSDTTGVVLTGFSLINCLTSGMSLQSSWGVEINVDLYDSKISLTDVTGFISIRSITKTENLSDTIAEFVNCSLTFVNKIPAWGGAILVDSNTRLNSYGFIPAYTERYLILSGTTPDTGVEVSIPTGIIATALTDASVMVSFADGKFIPIAFWNGNNECYYFMEKIGGYWYLHLATPSGATLTNSKEYKAILRYIY